MRRSAGWCAQRFKPAAHNPLVALNGDRLETLRGVVRSLHKPAAPPVVHGFQTALFRRRRHAIAEGCDDVSMMWVQGSTQTLATETMVVAASLRDTPTTRVQPYRPVPSNYGLQQTRWALRSAQVPTAGC